MSSLKYLRDAISKERDRWKSAVALEEAVRLQSTIEEHKKGDALRQKKEARIVLQQSRECRAFYSQEYTKRRQRFQDELNSSLDMRRAALKRMAAERREQTELKDWSLYEAEKEQKRRVEEKRKERAQAFVEEMSDHRRRIESVQERHRSEMQERIQSESRERREAILNCTKQIEVFREAAVENDKIAQALAEETERQRAELKEALAAERAARLREERRHKLQMQRRAHEIKVAREWQRKIDQFLDTEAPGRLRIVEEEQEERWPLVHDKQVEFSQLVQSFRAPAREKIQQRRAQSALAVLSEMEQRCESRTRQRERQMLARRKRLERRFERKQEETKQERLARLLKVHSFVRAEAQKATDVRLRTLERRRGEKAATECEPFVVSSTISHAVDPLPEHLRSVVIGIIREEQD